MTTLAVRGATLTYDVTGRGPALLLVPGGPADAAVFTPIRPLLAETHTASRSTRAACPQPARRRTG